MVILLMERNPVQAGPAAPNARGRRPLLRCASFLHQQRPKHSNFVAPSESAPSTCAFLPAGSGEDRPQNHVGAPSADKWLFPIKQGCSRLEHAPTGRACSTLAGSCAGEGDPTRRAVVTGDWVACAQAFGGTLGPRLRVRDLRQVYADLFVGYAVEQRSDQIEFAAEAEFGTILRSSVLRMICGSRGAINPLVS
jgi:hypothetical protein